MRHPVLALVLSGCAGPALAWHVYPHPGEMLYDVLNDDHSLNREALCDLEAQCSSRPSGSCTRFVPGRALPAPEEAELRACLHLARDCSDLRDCIQLDTSDPAGPFLGSALRPDGTLNVDAVCGFQAECGYDATGDCPTYLAENPATPMEAADLDRCLPAGATCEEATRCLGLNLMAGPGIDSAARARIRPGQSYQSTRRLAEQVGPLASELKAHLVMTRARTCACETRECVRGVERDLSAGLAKFKHLSDEQEMAAKRFVRPEMDAIKACRKRLHAVIDWDKVVKCEKGMADQDACTQCCIDGGADTGNFMAIADRTLCLCGSP